MKIIILAVITTVLIFLCAAVIFGIGCKIVRYLADELEKLQRFI